MNLEFNKYRDRDIFFNDFTEYISNYCNNYKELVKSGKHTEIINSLPNINEELGKQILLKIRKELDIPKRIKLFIDNKAITYYSSFNNNTKKFQINLPKTCVWHIKRKEIIESAIKHEIGHIVNGDLTRKTNDNKGANICQDLRINHYIEDESLVDLFDAVYYYRAINFNNEILTPKIIFPKWNLPIPKDNKIYSFDLIYNFYKKTKNQNQNQNKNQNQNQNQKSNQKIIEKPNIFNEKDYNYYVNKLKEQIKGLSSENVKNKQRIENLKNKINNL